MPPMAVKFLDYYETLGVEKSASGDDIKQAFRKLARVHHPDVAKNKVAGEAKFKEINEAYEVLSDPEKRRQYDELGANWQDRERAQADPRGGHRSRAGSPQDESDFEFGGTGFSDFFESFFSGRQGGFPGRGSPAGEGGGGNGAMRPGRDVEADLLVTLEEAFHGSQRKVTLRRPGMDGEPERTNTYQVRVPPGMREGQRIRLAGQGGAGFGGAPAGDLFLRVRFARHPDLRVQGDDIYYDFALAPWEAILGTKAKVPTLAGDITLRIAPGTTAGTRLRVRGQGLPRGDGGRGDLFAIVRLEVPATVSPEEHALWEKLSELSTFNPRKPS